MNNDLLPFFCFYGGKWRVANHYPAPQYRTLVEPFAGGAGYALRHANKNVLLYDSDPIIYGVWSYLIASSAQEIMRLPIEIKHINDTAICQEAKWLIGFWLNKGTSHPCLQPSKWMRSGIRPNSYWGENIRNRIATQIHCIKHWKITNASYEQAPDIEATWFVDPPYAGDCGKKYRHKITDHRQLGEWCRRRQGQTIVCEQEGAEWLPFSPFRTTKALEGAHGKAKSSEVIWTNAQTKDGFY